MGAFRGEELLDKLEADHALSADEWEELIGAGARDEACAIEVETRARRARDGRYGHNVFIRGLIELTNYCQNDCLYCGIRKSNADVRRYRLSKDEVLERCALGYDLGFRTFVLQGGEDPYYADDVLCDIVGAIRAQHPTCAITLSMGERSRASYQALFDAGADRYLLRHETADCAHYRSLHPADMSCENRQSCLYALKEIGYAVGAGFMVGTPGQTAWHLARDMVFLQDLQPEMVGIGPFVPHHSTPFGNHPGGSLEMTLFMLACTRLALPHALLPATTALGTIDESGREKGMDAGANVLMPNLSPVEHRADYSLYDNKISQGEEAAEGHALLRARMERAGYHLVIDRGDPRF